MSITKWKNINIRYNMCSSSCNHNVLHQPVYALTSTVLVFFCLHNHFFSQFIDLHYSKWKIGLKIHDYLFFTSILPKFWPFLQLWELLLCLAKYFLDDMKFCILSVFLDSLFNFAPEKWYDMPLFALLKIGIFFYFMFPTLLDHAASLSP